MIDMIRQWLWGVIAASVCLAILDGILPKGAIRGIAKITGGLIMFLVLLQPLAAANPDDWELDFDDYQEKIDSQISSYREDYQQQMESIIEDEMGAYISKKAEQLGSACRVKVVVETIQDAPVVESVKLYRNKDAQLAAWLEDELGIDRSRQYWEDEG